MVYFELDVTKRYLEINDNGEDELLTELGESADQRMNNFLTSIVGSDDLPLDGSLIDESIRDAVNFVVCARYLLIKKDHDSSKMWSEEAEKLRESIKNRLSKNADTYSRTVPRI